MYKQHTIIISQLSMDYASFVHKNNPIRKPPQFSHSMAQKSSMLCNTSSLFFQFFNLCFDYRRHLAGSRYEKPVHVEDCDLIVLTCTKLQKENG